MQIWLCPKLHVMYYNVMQNIPKPAGYQMTCTWKRTDTVIPAQHSPIKRKPPIISGLLPRRSIVKH